MPIARSSCGTMQQSSLPLGTCSLIAAMFIYSEVAAVASIYEKYKKAANLHAGIELLENSTGPKALKCRIGMARSIGYL